MEATASLCDGFIVTNDYLGQRLQNRFHKPYRVIRNTLNREQLASSEQCLKAKENAQQEKPFTIGYFSGTPTHINDFRTIGQELEQLLQNYPDIHLKVVGYMEFPEYMQQLIRSNRISFTPLVDFVELQRQMAMVEISIVPLIQNGFTNCKSELKFFEAAAVKTLTIAAPTYTYKNAIVNGETGFLCEPGQWYDCIEHFYLNQEEMKEIAEKAYHYCLQNYSGEKVIREIEEAYNFFEEYNKSGRF